MTVTLRQSRSAGALDGNMPWLAILAEPTRDERPNRLPAARMLDAAFNDIAEEWWSIARESSGSGNADCSYAMSCTSYVSDFGIMLAWSHIVTRLAAEDTKYLVVCDDPWMFRHLQRIVGVTAGSPPPIWPRAIRLRMRGGLARARLATRMARAAMASRRRARAVPTHGAAMISYGHPASDAGGTDAYFGCLMHRVTGLTRVLHTDCQVDRAGELGAEGKGVSLHGWGRVPAALGLLGTFWRPARAMMGGKYDALVRRAAEMERSVAAAASVSWQIRCQRAWLEDTSPRCIVWPWENHAWERALVRDARALGIQTIGYQHTVVGKQIFNYSPKGNRDGLDSVPDIVFCNGPTTAAQLRQLGVPADRLRVAGAWRLPEAASDIRDPAGPVFVAMSSDADISAQMLSAIARTPWRERPFLIKQHPMYPLEIPESEGVTRTETPLTEQERVSSVVFATGAVGLEAVLAGLPTLRFLPEGKVAIDILPDGIPIPSATADELGDALARLDRPPELSREAVVSPVDMPLWSRYLEPT